MIVFFDKIAFRFFLFSKLIHKNIFGLGNYNNEAKIQTLFAMSLWQGVYVFFIILDFILAISFEIKVPEVISLVGLVLFCFYNYFRYYKTRILDDMIKEESLFFKSSLITNIITLLYFLIGIFLFFKVGDFVRSQLAPR